MPENLREFGSNKEPDIFVPILMELIKVNNTFFGKELDKCNGIETFVEYLIINQTSSPARKLNKKNTA